MAVTRSRSSPKPRWMPAPCRLREPLLVEHEADAYRIAGVAHLLHHLERRRRAARDSDTSDALSRILVEAIEVTLNFLLVGNFQFSATQALLEEPARALTNDSVRRPVCIPVQRTARRVRRVLADAGGVQNVAVDDRDVARAVGDADRMCRRDLVEIVPVRMTSQENVIVSVAVDHFARRRDGRFLLQLRDELIHGLGAIRAQPYTVIHRPFVVDLLRMHMRIVEAGHHRRPMHIDHSGFGCFQLEDFPVTADSKELPVFVGEGLGRRAGRIDGDHVRVDNDGLRGECRVRGQQDGEAQLFDHNVPPRRSSAH